MPGWALLVPVTTGGLMVLLAAGLLWLDAASRPVRAFVVFLLLRAGVSLGGVLAAFAPSWSDAIGRTLVHYQIATVFALLAFLCVYPRTTPLARARWPVPTIALLTIATLVALARDPCRAACIGTGYLGPLAALVAIFEPIVAFGGLVLLVRSIRAPEGPSKVSMQLVALGLLIDATVSSVLGAAILDPGPGPILSAFEPDAMAVVMLAAPPAAWALVGAAVALALRARLPRARAAAVALVALAGVASLVLALEPLGGPLYDLGVAVVSAARVALPLLAAFALARHRLFDIDLRARKLLDAAAVGSLFAAIFFVTSEAGAYYLGSRLGVFTGIAITGLALPFLAPLKRLAERAVTRAVGPATPLRELPPAKRAEIYADFARQAWADGTLAGQERLFLDDLRERLGLPFEIAAHAETVAARGAPFETTEVIP